MLLLLLLRHFDLLAGKAQPTCQQLTIMMRVL